MSIIVKTLIESKDAENAQTTQYTSSSVRAIIDKFTATNHTANTATLSVNLVPSGSTAGSTNLIISTRSILPGESYLCPELVGHILSAGDFISTIAGTASAICIRASGREVST